ncbi:MAG: excinuclease ABC subunit UvrA [Pirellulaceae bacterium]|nr:excinuclease ABC subunit UvrA [Pirellulaceae bacterium]
MPSETRRSGIRALGVAVHNLQQLDLTIPHGQWLTLCGRSGSGKTSLALDTLYAEGQRRYIESFSAYTRQYLNALEKPNAREITGIPPSIAVTRSSRGLTGRATVGSNTEILDYLREVYAKLSEPICRSCQRPVQKYTTDGMATAVARLPSGTRVVTGFTWSGPSTAWEQVSAHLLTNGFTRVSIDGQRQDLASATMAVREVPLELENAELPLLLALESLGWRSVHNPMVAQLVSEAANENDEQPEAESFELPKRGSPKRAVKKKPTTAASSTKRKVVGGPANNEVMQNVDVIVDRWVVGQTARERMVETLDTAVAVGGRAFVWVPDPAAEDSDSRSPVNSKDNDGAGNHEVRFPIALPYRCLGQWGWRYHFSEGWECDGCNQSFPLPTPALFSYNSPVGACPTCEGFGSVSQYDIRKIVPNTKKALRLGAIAPWTTPKYSKKWRKMMPQAEAAGLPLDKPFAELTLAQVEILWQGSRQHKFPGLNGFFRWMEKRKYKMHYRIFMARWRSYFECTTCHGERLNVAARQFCIDQRSLPDASHLKLDDLKSWLEQLSLTPTQQQSVRTVLPQVLHRLQYLIDVGLPYVTLDRTLRTLSGGELQRTALTTALGSALVNLLYVLDEPSVGLHPRDIERLTQAISRLHRAGNTVITVEHETAMLQAADRIVEIGPGAGALGGKIVFDGTYAELCQDQQSLTAKYLRPVDHQRVRRSPRGWVELTGARGNNLKSVDVKFPTGVLCLVTGVSGSGKSSLVRQTLVPALQVHWGEKADQPLPFASLSVPPQIAALGLIDGSPIGRSPRSNAVTYVKAFDAIRKLFAETSEAKNKRLTAGSFSFNVAGGRCEKCEGDGTMSIDMQFLPDVTMTCPECQGKRYQKNVLEVTVSGKNIDEILQMTVREAFMFFRHQSTIQKQLKPLLDVGLDYLPLGQGAPTLSSGESQRLKLAAFLGGGRQKPTLFVMDEPTTGLHPADIDVLLQCFDALLSVGHSLLIIEHNLQLMRAADYLIDIGPDAAERGGEVVVAGVQQDLVRCPASVTGKFLSGPN